MHSLFVMFINLGKSIVQTPRENNLAGPDQEPHKPLTWVQPRTAHDATLARAEPSRLSGTAGGLQEAEQAVYGDQSLAAGVAPRTNARCLAVGIALCRSRCGFVAWPAASGRRLGDRSSLRPWVGGSSSYRVFRECALDGRFACGCCACSRFGRKI